MTSPIEKISIVSKLCEAVTQPLYGTDIAIMVLWYLDAIYHEVQNNNGTSSINLSAIQAVLVYGTSKGMTVVIP